MNEFTLGLDIGTNSIGWAAIEHNNNRQPAGIVACGSRIFLEAVDAKTRTPKNQARRAARSARRLISRRRMRKNNVRNLLLKSTLLPENAFEREKLFTNNKSYDPYELRKRSLNNRVELYELGRVLYHLCQRRGFQSNRKVTSKDDSKVKNAISSLRQEMGSNTLGEYLASQSKKRNRYTDRSMYEEEFDRIWQAQQRYYPELLNQSLKVAIHNAMFFQRPLKIQKNLVGKCTFELSRKRAARALLESQRFRILQDVNNLAIKNPITREFRPLSEEERGKLLKLLYKQKTLSWNKARSTLRLHEGEVFNLEEGKKKELSGNRTAFALRSIFGSTWDDMTTDNQNALVIDMLTIDNEQGFLNRMKSHWSFVSDIAEKLAKTELEPGYTRLSRKAICKILPYLEQGMTYDKACLEAGYDHSNTSQQPVIDKLGEPPYLRNPIVQKALYETRKVVNAIIRQYGTPATIRIEMARDMKLTRKQRDDLQKRQKNNEKTNDKARKILQNEFSIQNPSRDAIQKYNMWVECGNICPYTGRVISREMLFSPEVDIEHILPYSRSLDDSYMNKTLCMSAENRAIKHNRTPYEAYHSNTTKYEEILQRIKALPYPKRKKFEQKEIDTDKFVERQLNDTRYICTEVKRYLQPLGVNVEISKGEATAALRHKWNLNRILAIDRIEKNREDHRHHAIDATIIALTSRTLFQDLSRMSAQSGVSLSERGFPLDKPWPSFYHDVDEKVKSIVVSHAPCRKISDALHQETAYGFIESKKRFAYRKPLSDIKTQKQIESIGDLKIQELVMQRLNAYNGDFKKAFGDSENPLLHVDGKTPIISVRLHVKVRFPETTMLAVKRNDKAYKYFELGNNHHVEIIENIKTGKRKGIFISAIEAARRARIDKTSIVQRDHGPEWKFVMVLHINDIAKIERNNQCNYYRVQKMDSSNKRITFRMHLAAKFDDKNTEFVGYPTSLRCNKVMVDVLGNVTPCND